MASGMPYDRARQRMVREQMTAQEESAGGREKLPHEKVIVKGRAERQAVYRLAVEDLAFNKANGRIKAEVLEKEAEFGRELQASNLDDQKIIKEILLSIRPDENEKILEDLQANGQLRPGIVTCDGIVINGNRRKAILEELHGKTGDSQFKYLDVHVLPSDITKRELWLIEAGIQLSAPQQLDYSPINHLLKLREGHSSGLDIDEMAARIYGVSREKIQSDLERLNVIDEYLRDFLRKQERYYLVKQLNEHFIDLQNVLSWLARPRGIKLQWQPDPSDINELKLVAFYYIRLRFPHLRIRELRDLFTTKESWKEVKKALNVKVTLSADEKRRLGLLPPKPEGDDDDEDEDTLPETPATTAEERDLQEEAVWRDVHKADLHGYYENAKEQKQLLRDSERPLALAIRALKAIEAIPTDRRKLAEPTIDDVLRRVIERINALRKLLNRKGPAKKRRREQ